MDEPFLYALFLEARPELAWLPEPMRRMQFALRARAYAAASSFVVVVDGAPVGVLTVADEPTAMRVVDIAITRTHRGRGLGRFLLEDLAREARARAVPLRLAVIATSPARRLYERLGFQAVETSAFGPHEGVGSLHQEMELRP